MKTCKHCCDVQKVQFTPFDSKVHSLDCSIHDKRLLCLGRGWKGGIAAASDATGGV